MADDWSLIGTADRAITYSATPQEVRHGLARLFVDKARSDKDKFGVLISQNYAFGQFVLDSAPLHDAYWEVLKDVDDDEEDSSDDDEE